MCCGGAVASSPAHATRGGIVGDGSEGESIGRHIARIRMANAIQGTPAVFRYARFGWNGPLRRVARRAAGVCQPKVEMSCFAEGPAAPGAAGFRRLRAARCCGTPACAILAALLYFNRRRPTAMNDCNRNQITPPPPPRFRGIISGVFLAGIAVLTLAAVPSAEAQTPRTYTFTASINGGAACTDCQATEGDTFTLTLTVSGITSGGAIWSPVVFGGDATAGLNADYGAGVGVPPDRFRGGSIAAGSGLLSSAATFTIYNDISAEPAETITVSVPVVSPFGSNSDTYTTTSTTITITIRASNAVATTRTLTVTGPSTITETDGNIESGNYTIDLAGTAFPSATTVVWAVTDGTTTAADFFLATDRAGTVSFGTADTSLTFTLTITGDDLNEPDETFSVQVSVANPTADGGTAYGSPATTTIEDDDPVTVAIARHSGCAASVAESVGN
ncbi:MAG: hypothetical protein OXU61_09165, partial [Gammaproteobacteria bacterium]|nr:hypothetical protein [Gammaproteobacteria bacterium]